MSGLVTGKFRAAWEEKILKDINRHRLIDPNTDVKKLIERTIRQEIEILFIESVINDLLPELEVILKRNC